MRLAASPPGAIRPLSRRFSHPIPLLLLLALGTPGTARAINYTWSDATGGAWTDNLSWLPFGVPGASDNATISLSGNYTVTISANTAVNSLTVTGTGTKTLRVMGGATLSSNASPIQIDSGSILRLDASNTGGTAALRIFGELDARGACAINDPVATASTTLIRVIGGGSATTLTVANGFSSAGMTQLTNEVLNGSATLKLNAGTLVIPSGATLSALTGATGGSRTVQANVNNQGIISVNTSLTLTSTGTNSSIGTIDLNAGTFRWNLSGASANLTDNGAISLPAGTTFFLNGTGNPTVTRTVAGVGGTGALQLTGVTANLVEPFGGALTLTSSTVDFSAGGWSTATHLTTIDHSTVDLSGGSLTNVSGQTLQLLSSALTGTLSNSGIVVVEGTSSLSGTYSPQSGSTLRIQGRFSGSATDALFTVPNAFNNNATIELTSTGGVADATLQVSGATVMTNLPGHTINALAGSGGDRFLKLGLINQGTLGVGANLTIDKASADHANSSVINVTGGNLTYNLSGSTPTLSLLAGTSIVVSPGRVFAVFGGTLNQSGGGIGGGGQLGFSNQCVATFASNPTIADINFYKVNATLPGGLTTATQTFQIGNATIHCPLLTVATGTSQDIFTSNIDAPLTVQGTLNVQGACTVTGNVNTTSGSAVNIKGMTSNSSMGVTGACSSAGTIDLTSPAAFEAAISVTSGLFTNQGTGTLSCSEGAGGTRRVSASFTNLGIMNVAQATTIVNPGGGTVTNNGTCNITGGSLAVTNSGAGSNLFLNGAVNVSGGNLSVDQSSVGVSSVKIGGTFTMSAGRSFSITGDSFQQTGGTIGNSGAISLTNVLSASFNGVPNVASITLTNSAAQFTAPLSTATTSLALSGSTLTAPGITNPSGHTLSFLASTLNGPLDNGGTLSSNGNCHVTGPVTLEAGGILNYAPNGAATFQLPAGTTNSGTINLSQAAAAATTTINMSGGTLTNANGGAINTVPPVSGPIVLNGTLVNHGSITLAGSFSVDQAGAEHLSDGVIRVNSPGSLHIVQTGTNPKFTNMGSIILSNATVFSTGGMFRSTGGGAELDGRGTLDMTGSNFQNGGLILPGADIFLAGTINIIGNLNCEPTSYIESYLNGKIAGTTFDRVTVTGSANLAGTFAVIVPALTMEAPAVDGMEQSGASSPTGAASPAGATFIPAIGDTFQVMTWGSHTGTFSRLDGFSLSNGLDFVPRPAYPGFGATFLTLDTVIQQWSQLSPTGTPPSARQGHSAVYDPADNRMVVFGGRDAFGVRNDLWVMTNANGATGTPAWTQLSPSGTPPAPREGHSAVYDAANHRMIVYGGNNGAPSPTTFSDIFVLTNADGTSGTPAWVTLTPSGSPPPRSGQGAGYDPGSNRMIVFGGAAVEGSCGQAKNDLFVMTNANGIGGAPFWSTLAPSGTPPSVRRRAAVSYSSGTNRMVVAGGDNLCGTVRNDLFTLSMANSVGGAPQWSAIPLTDPPGPQFSGLSGVYDGVLNRFDCFGGRGSNNLLSNGSPLIDRVDGSPRAPSWGFLPATAGDPPAREHHTAVYDATGRRIMVFGGQGTAALLSDVWVLRMSGGPAEVVGVPGAPPPAGNPASLAFLRNPWPNPGSGPVEFAIEAPKGEMLEVAVFDVSGRMVADLRHAPAQGGEELIRWDARTSSGEKAASGLYWIRARAGGQSARRRVAITK